MTNYAQYQYILLLYIAAFYNHAYDNILLLYYCFGNFGSKFVLNSSKVSKEAKIRNRYNHVPHLTQDTTRESDKNTIQHHTQESQEVSPFPTVDHKAAMS